MVKCRGCLHGVAFESGAGPRYRPRNLDGSPLPAAPARRRNSGCFIVQVSRCHDSAGRTLCSLKEQATRRVALPAGEAGAIAGRPEKWLLLLAAFCMRGFGLFLCGLRLLPGLGRMLLALGVVVLAVRIRGRAVCLCGGLVMFRRLVVCIFHGGFSLLAD
jgi:hypothetical protein